MIDRNVENPLMVEDALNLPEAHFAAIGRVVTVWADLEFAIDHTIWFLLGVEQVVGACLTAQIISIHPRLRALRSLIHLRGASEALTIDFGRFVGEMNPMVDRRNRIIHDKRMFDAAECEALRFQVRADKRLSFGPQSETIEEIDRFVSEVSEAIIRFDALCGKLFEELESSIEKRQQPSLHIWRVPRHWSDPSKHI